MTGEEVERYVDAMGILGVDTVEHVVKQFLHEGLTRGNELSTPYLNEHDREDY